MPQPAPFEIVEQDGLRVASNGQLRVLQLERDGRLFRRRGIAGLSARPAAEVLLPQLNALAGELLANPGMSAREAVDRVRAIAGMVPVAAPQRSEWAVAEVDGVRVYVDGESVIVTRQDLQP